VNYFDPRIEMKNWADMNDTERLLSGIKTAVDNAKYDYDKGVIDAIENGSDKLASRQETISNKLSVIILLLSALLITKWW
jgi:hypothetical protein